MLLSSLVVGCCLATVTPIVSSPQETQATWPGIRKNYDQLKSYMASKRRIGEAEREELRSLQTSLDQYRQANPTDPRPIAMDIQIASWLDDDTRLDADYAALAALSQNPRVQIAWATHRLGQNEYDQVREIIEAAEIDPQTHPQAMILLARSMMARNRFQDAIDSLDRIPSDATMEPRVRSDSTRIRGEATRWLGLWDEETQAREAEEAAGDSPIMQLVTSQGPVTILLFEDAAPNTVANFIELSERDFYDGTTFHRVEPNFVVQGGDPNSRPGSPGEPGTGGRSGKIADESNRPNKRYHFAGAVAMAKSPDANSGGRTVPNSGSSQFYVVLEPAENLNAEYTVFGRVIDGMDAIEAMRVGDELLDVKTISRPDKEYVADTLPLAGIPTPGGTPPATPTSTPASPPPASTTPATTTPGG